MTTIKAHASIYSFLWFLIKPFKWHYLIMLLAPILGAFYDFANNYSLKLVIDAFSLPGDVSYEHLLAPIVIFIAAQVLLDVFWRISDVAEWRSEPYVRKNLISHVYAFIQARPYTFFQNTPAGTITSRIKGVLDGYDNFWAAIHHDFTPALANTVVLSATLAVVNFNVCLMVSLWALVFFTVMYRISTRLDQLSFVNSTHRHALLGSIADNVTNMFTILSFSTRAHELNRLKTDIDKDFIPSSMRVYRFDFFGNVVAALLYWSMMTSLFLYMIHLRKTGAATNGDIVFVMGIVIRMCYELWRLIRQMQKFMKDVGDFKSAFTIMQTVDETDDTANLPALVIKKPSITFDKVCFSYGDGPVFNNLSVAIRPGEKVGLVGVSGAGKSTFVSLLLKYFSPHSGQVLVDGHNIANVSNDSLRSQIAVIPQDIMLFHQSILENIRYGHLTATREEVVAAASIANIHEFIETLPQSYDTLVGERGIKLSGGQRQRIAIARAILKNAPILILDEATSSLDAEVEHLIQKSLDRLFHNSTTTVIAIAHRLSTLKNLDRIIVLEKGVIVEQGSFEMLQKNGDVFKRLWEMQKLA